MAEARRRRTEDLLASFKKGIDQRVERGERKAVHASMDKDSQRSNDGRGKKRESGDRSALAELASELEAAGRPKRVRERSPDGDDARLGRGGRLAIKQKAKGTATARGRDLASSGNLANPKSVLVSNVPAKVRLSAIKELFESAAGRVSEARKHEDGVVQLTFEKPQAAFKAQSEFDGGELADQIIKVELVNDDDDEL
eukprot:TRINITY_DN41515_c0_g1_i1.p1 TRINITY_DN41515_c0_g1~~TRINITY_DN41515_c0_g1_i1.p1  ORF type:complete len:217 (+),score=48.19 TRINITY_DN41515_c0_g1_i1:59-652(+)